MTTLEGLHFFQRRHVSLSARVIASFDIIVVLSSIIISMVFNDWSWFQRSGSLLAMLGAVDFSNNARSKQLSTLSVISGTLIWGYGDLVGGI